MKKNVTHNIVHFTYPIHPTSTSERLERFKRWVSTANQIRQNLRIAVVLSENLTFRNCVEQFKPLDIECLVDLFSKSWSDCTRRVNSKNKLIKSYNCHIIYSEKIEVTCQTINKYKQWMVIQQWNKKKKAEYCLKK